MQKIGEAMQQAQATGAQASSQSSSQASSNKPDVEEAEVEILDDEDKKKK